MCLKQFLSEQKQYQLRRLAQIQSVKHEDAILRYKSIFLQELREACLFEPSLCSINCSDSDICIHNRLKPLKDCYNEVEYIFDMIHEIYVAWINSFIFEAYKKLLKLVETYDLLTYTYNIQNHILFRGRISKNIVTPFDLFHIPFDKRYLIRNQRYSLNGQPLLYLGFSVYDVVKELSIENNNDFTCSTFVSKDVFEVYDFRNDFINYYMHYDTNEFMKIGHSLQTDNDIKKALHKLILISCCSFQKRSNHQEYTFTEEYVLPQLIAQLLKEKAFKGILYNSALIEANDTVNKYSTLYKSNVAIFTNYITNHVYDKNLYDQFIISNPLRLKDQLENITIDNLIELGDKIKIKSVRSSSNIPMNIKNEFGHIVINGEKYFDTEYGKYNLFLAYLYLYDQYNQIIS